MKKIVLSLCLVILCGCDLNFGKTNATDLIFNYDGSNDEINTPKYVDENPVEISLYVDNAFGGLDIVNDEFKDTWRKKRDIVVFGSLFTTEEVIDADYFQNMWRNAASNYPNYEKYKTGWIVSFELKDGTKIHQRVINPSDVDYFYDYLEIYMYDSANQKIGVWYSHLLDEQMTNKTVMTSMKLTAGSLYEEINGPITVTVFTYDTEDDFDENGDYRGNSFATAKVYNKVS